MATDAIFHLDRLRCDREADASGGSEPYIWPALVFIDNNTFGLPNNVGVVVPPLSSARVVIKNDMRAGQTADIPAAVNTLRTRLDDNLSILHLILIVVLMEKDDTPDAAARAGYSAFANAVGPAIGSRLSDLSQAHGDAELQPIIDEIIAEVKAKVTSATSDALTAYQKLRVALGLLNLDDNIGAGFKHFTVLAPQAQPFAISYTAGSPRFTDIYAINGRLEAAPVRVDICQSFVDAVHTAQAGVDGILAEIASLQAELSGHREPGEPPLPKTFIIQEIDRLRTEDLPQAEAALEAAQAALNRCRNRFIVHDLPGQVLTLG